jgi:hypothetical protein
MPSRGGRVALLGAALLAAAYAAVAATSPPAVGIWQDDGIYVATARSLAAGTGYRHIELAGQPLQTKYPPLYPAVLALVLRWAPDLPRALPLLLLPTVLAAAALVALSAVYCRSVFRVPGRAAWTLAALAAVSPALVAFVRYPMSDLLYGALAAAALLCLDARAAGARSRRAETAWIALGALLAGLALLTRGIGGSLAGAAVLGLALRRRPRAALLAALVVLACAVPWWLWQARAADVNGPLQTARLQAPDLGYALWLPQDPGQTLRVVQQNLLRAAVGVFHFQLAPPIGATGAAFGEVSWRTGLVHALTYATVGLLLLGFARSFRAGWRTLHLYALAYAGMVLTWPFDPHRFLVPWTPFLLYFGYEGLRGLGDAAARLRRRPGTPPPLRLVAPAVAALLLALFAAEDVRIVGSTAERYYLRERPSGFDLAEVARLEAWIRRHTPESAVIASVWPARLFLTTGRRGVVFWPDTDPYARYYGPDRRAASFYVVPSASEAQAMLDDMRAHWRRTWRDAGVTHYVAERSLRESRIFARAVGADAEVFELLHETPGGAWAVYRLRWDRRGSVPADQDDP